MVGLVNSCMVGERYMTDQYTAQNDAAERNQSEANSTSGGLISEVLAHLSEKPANRPENASSRPGVDSAPSHGNNSAGNLPVLELFLNKPQHARPEACL